MEGAMAPAVPSAGHFPRAAVAALASLLTPRALVGREPAGLWPSLGIFPNISWELWEGERGELQQVLVGSGCPQRSPCVCVVLGGALGQTHDPAHHPTIPAGGFGHGGGTGHIRLSPVHPGHGVADRGYAGSWGGSEGKEGVKPSCGAAGQD